MELKDKLQKIFNGDYPGSEVFIRDVIRPIFGNEINYVNVNLAEDSAYHDKAEKAGIKHLRYVADIVEQNYNADNIALFDVTLDDRKNIERSRVNIQQLIRSIVQEYSHILIVFHYEDVEEKPWRFSYAYKQDTQANTTPAKRYTYVFGRDFRGRTAAERFCLLAQSERKNSDFVDAFSVEALSDEFFNLYRAYYATFVEYIIGEKYTDEKKLNNIIKGWNWRTNDTTNQFATTFDNDAKATRDYIKKMFGRIVFLYFLQRKGWLYNSEGKSDAQYMRHLYEKAEQRGLADRFLDDVLEILFFYILNTKEPKKRIDNAKQERGKDVRIIPGWDKIPFLNGGLFQDDDIDRLPCVFPASYFRELFTFLDSYNFTINENDQEDAEVGIDPEMLGRIFENLLEDNKDKGAFYTPKEIVDYMCRESLIAYLQDDKFSKESNSLIRSFVEKLDKQDLSDKQRIYLRDKLKAVKICDPAIGSGAFPMGLINLLAKLYISLGVSSEEMANIKRHIMEKNIYGVDIEQGAVDIARLRFWLAMVVDETEPAPLPNLHFKIMQGNSLLESFKGKDLSGLMTGTGDFFADSEREQLNKLVNDFYNEQSHIERSSKLEQIRQNIHKQIYFLTNDELSDLNPIANEKFFLWHTWFADVFKNGGFDIVIGNPPYIKEYTNRKAFDGFREMSPYYQGKMDLWYGFACLSIDLLKYDGILCFIATNNWVASAGASKLRGKIRYEAKLCQFIDFGTYMIFGDSASIQTMVMLAKKNNTALDFSTAFSKNTLSKSSLSDIIKLLKGDAEKASYGVTTFKRSEKNSIFSFGENAVNQVCVKMSENAFFLDGKNIAQGIIGAPDEAFIVSDLNKFTEIERQYIKPYYTGLQNKYRLNRADKYIIYLSAHNFSEQSFSESKGFVSHFEPFKAKLIESKIKFKTPDKPYYYLHRERKEHFFKENIPRLITQGRAQIPTFVYTEDDCYPSRALFVITSNQFNLKFLCAVLNSKLIKFWLRNRGKMQGACFQIDKGHLLSIPIKFKQEYESPLINAIDQILSSKISSNLYSKIVLRIDDVVYHLYDLTYDEVLIVDPETPITRKEYETFNLDFYGQS